MNREEILKTYKRLRVETRVSSLSSLPNLKFCRNSFRTTVTGKKKEFKSPNKIGFLKTRTQPNGTNAYFNILKQKIEIQELLLGKTRQKHVIPFNLSCVSCSCGDICCCGRRRLTQNPRNTYEGITQRLSTLHRSNRSLFIQCSGDLKKIKKILRGSN